MEQARAAEQEARNQEHHFEHHGVQFTLPAKAEMLPVDAIEAFEEDKIIAFIRAMIGLEKWKEWKDSFPLKGNPTMSDLNDLSKALGEPYGFESTGESSASKSSSVETSQTSRHSFSENTEFPSPQPAGVATP